MSAQEPTQIRPEDNVGGEPRWEQPRFDGPSSPGANQPPIVQGQVVGIRSFQVAPPSESERVVALIRTWVWPACLVAALITNNWGPMLVTGLVVAIVSGSVLKRMRQARRSGVQ